MRARNPDQAAKSACCSPPHQLLDRFSALIPPPRRHRHRYYGVLAPNSPYRPAVTALAAAESACNEGKGKAEAETEETPVRRAARYVWAMLLARIYEVFPFICPKCGGTMKIIAFIDEGEAVREILAHLASQSIRRASPRLTARRCEKPPGRSATIC